MYFYYLSLTFTPTEGISVFHKFRRIFFQKLQLNVLHTYSGKIFIQEKKRSSDICYNLHEI